VGIEWRFLEFFRISVCERLIKIFLAGLREFFLEFYSFFLKNELNLVQKPLKFLDLLFAKNFFKKL
jgi:hypothetical protein